MFRTISENISLGITSCAVAAGIMVTSALVPAPNSQASAQNHFHSGNHFHPPKHHIKLQAFLCNSTANAMVSRFVSSSGTLTYTFSATGAFNYTCDNAGVVINFPKGITNFQSFSYTLDQQWAGGQGPDIVVSFVHNGTPVVGYFIGPVSANVSAPFNFTVTAADLATLQPPGTQGFAPGDTLNSIALAFLPGAGGGTTTNGTNFMLNGKALAINLKSTAGCQTFIQTTFRNAGFGCP